MGARILEGGECVVSNQVSSLASRENETTPLLLGNRDVSNQVSSLASREYKSQDTRSEFEIVSNQVSSLASREGERITADSTTLRIGFQSSEFPSE